ncbi:MAG TPA: pyridoxamine 5'-phosphate oxidase family protein [Gemmatimonadaceae bacterium]|jgi:nitroimidazol reductase NimA-like FMN-containing flavoprotein (pyridoxamine 5'-phosphate oxidase superfamily)|nr:pyridoxamine 5'-phosphate oxidase family protein [Gemmatimonadaceae bacterium]
MIENTAVLKVSPAGDDVPLFTVLGKKACEAILSRNSVGRIAFALHDRVSIVPIHYVYASGWIYGRTAAAGKLLEILRNRRIAFEVDEHSRLFEWRSVVVSGPLYVMEPGSTAAERRSFSKAVSLIRQLLPTALTDADPVPFRDQLFRIRVAEMSGRASGPTGGRRIPPSPARPTGETGEPDADALLCKRVQSALTTMPVSARSQVHVDAFDGLIVLTGIAEDSAERSAIETAVLSVPNVQAVVQQLETLFPSQQQPAPAEIAREALGQLQQAPRVDATGIKVVAEHGWLRLEGVANSRRTREEVVRRLRGVKGSRGVIDKLQIMGSATAQVVVD